MKNTKKTGTLLIAGLTTFGIVGGTLAWFSSEDTVRNIFSTGSGGIENPLDAGVDVEEVFRHPGEDGTLGSDDDIYPVVDGSYFKPSATGSSFHPGEDGLDNTSDDIKGDYLDANGNLVSVVPNEYVSGLIQDLDHPLVPGVKMDKIVRMHSEVNYNQYLRVKPVARFTFDGNLVTHYKVDSSTNTIEYSDTTGEGFVELNIGMLQGTVATPSTTVGDSWTGLEADGYIYYNQVFEPETYTTPIMEQVWLDPKTDNIYRNLGFEIDFEAETIQQEAGAASASGWLTSVPAAGLDGYQ